MAPGSHRQLSSRSDVRACHPPTTRAWVVVVGGWTAELSPGRTLTHTSALSLIVALCVLSNIHGAAAIVVSEYLSWRRLQAEGNASLVEAPNAGGWPMCGSVCFYNDGHRYGIKLLQGDFSKHTYFCAHTLRGSMFTCIIVMRLSDSCSAKWLSCSGSCLCHLWALMRPRQERRVHPNEAAVTADEQC